jgi:hypothetical protein
MTLHKHILLGFDFGVDELGGAVEMEVDGVLGVVRNLYVLEVEGYLREVHVVV